MKRGVLQIVALAFALAGATASAQPAPAASAGAAGQASAPMPGTGRAMGGGPGAGMRGMGGGGMGGAMGPGGGMGRGMARYGADVTPGWSLMTPDERLQHQQAMRSMTDVGECRAYVRRHHAEMAARALSRGQQVPASPRRDLCAGLAR